jgi:hypothetical protein
MNNYVFLCMVLLLALSVRLIGINFLPNGFSYDEAAYAYNAYSLRQTGADEFGNQWPLFLKSYGEYKPALLSYLLMPLFIYSYPSITSLRIVMVLFSLVGLIASYHLFRKLFNDSIAALISTAFMALSPWHIHYSRLLLDPILGFSLMLIGFSLMLADHKYYKTTGLISLVMSMYAYNAQRLIVPFMLMVIAIVKYYQRNSHKNEHPPAFFAFMLSLLVSVTLLSGDGGARVRDTSFINYESLSNQVHENWYRSQVSNVINSRLISNKAVIVIFDAIQRNLKHVQSDFLFFDGNISPRHGSNRHGNLLLFSLPLIFMGLIVVFSNLKQKNHQFMVALMFISITAGGFSTDIPHSGRTLSLLIPVTYLFTTGVMCTLKYFQTPFKKRALLAIMLLIASFNLTLYIRDTYIYFPEDSFLSFQGEFKDIMTYVHEHRNTYERIIFRSTDIYTSPYILYAWYNRLDPLLVLKYHQDIDKNIDNINFSDSSTKPYQCHLLQNKVMVIGPYTSSFNITTPYHTFNTFNRYHEQNPTYVAYDSELLRTNWGEKLEAWCQNH